ncbi:hypothetical protein ACO2Q9_02680 [Variovorax sp. VNK109]|uniref:hypothetical protein n=1 Tax=Variovorax sp. VNK109 TaxID=3400919 RepID=UPI003C087EA7
MLKVRSRPQEFMAVQWHQPGDASEVEVRDPLRTRAGDERWGVHSMDRGFQALLPGSWIVFNEGNTLSPHVYAPARFHALFEVAEEEQHG